MFPWQKKLVEEVEMTPETQNDNARLAALEEQIQALRPKSPAADTCSRCGLYCLLGSNFLHDNAGRFICSYCVREQHSTTSFGGINDLESSKDWAVSRLLGIHNKKVGIGKRLDFKFAYELFDSIPRSSKRFAFVDSDALRKAFDHEYQPSHSIGYIAQVIEYLPVLDPKGRRRGEKEVKHDPVFVPQPQEVRRNHDRPMSPEERQDQQLEDTERLLHQRRERDRLRAARLDAQIKKLQEQRDVISK